MATTQYIASIYPPMTSYVFTAGQLTLLGVGIVGIFMLIYLIINYWGIQLFTKINNSITTLKIIIPIATAIIVFIAAFHSSNFHAQDNHFVPFGTSSIFSVIVSCGTFSSVFGGGFGLLSVPAIFWIITHFSPICHIPCK